jgi:hypothetical protein
LKFLQKTFLVVAAVCDRRDFEGISSANGAHRAPLQDFGRDFHSSSRLKAELQTKRASSVFFRKTPANERVLKLFSFSF